MAGSDTPIRLLTAVPLCDGHDSAISTINLELIRHGIEVIYLGYHRSVRDVVRAAVQEDVRAVGISSYNGGHIEFFSDVLKALRAAGAGDIGVFGGGGGTITRSDAVIMKRRGVDRIFFPGGSLTDIVRYVEQTYDARSRSANGRHRISADLELARALTAPPRHPLRVKSGARSSGPAVVGITGPGGAGKTTLIDELVFRLLRRSETSRIGILSHDPSLASAGALLGDRATMIYSQNDRVFMRSLGSRGQTGGLAAQTPQCLRIMRRAHELTSARPFDWVFVETVGTGQEALPFPPDMVDMKVLVMSPEYGGRLQLQKIAMLEEADIVVVNKSDLAPSKTAQAEIERRLQDAGGGRRMVATVAKQHADAGVDRLLEMLESGIVSRQNLAVREGVS